MYIFVLQTNDKFVVGATCVNYLHKLYTYFKNNFCTVHYGGLFIFLCCQNLDVNSAVNNLLSRDDEDGAGDHDDAVLGFLPSGGELSEAVVQHVVEITSVFIKTGKHVTK